MVSIHTNPIPKPKSGTVVVDWSPRICGATAWGGHLQAADRSIELLSFSKSGRPLASWESAFDWQARKISDAAAILNDYDKIILGDIVCFAPDVVPDDDGRPYYEEIMHKVHRPWTGIFHGGTYPDKHDDTINAVLTSPGFCGTLLTPRMGQAKSRLAKWPALRFEHTPYLPYDAFQAPERRLIRGRTKDVMMTARLMANKGQNAALVLAGMLRGDTHIWGYNPYGFPSIGWGLLELGTLGLGYSIKRKPILRRDKMTMTHPNAVKFYTGEYTLETPTGREYRYHDGYLKLSEIDWSPWIHMSLASPDFAGMLEYTIIDAVHCGAIVAVPECFPIEGKYESLITFPFDGTTIGWDNNSGRVRNKRPFDPGPIADVINKHLKMSHADLAALQERQYQEFRRLHDPNATLKAINRALRGHEKNKWEYGGRPITAVIVDRKSDIPGPQPDETEVKYLYRLLVSGVRDNDEIRSLWKTHYGKSINRHSINIAKQKIWKNGSLTPATSTVVLTPTHGERRGDFIDRCITSGMANDTILKILQENYSASARNAEINAHRKQLRSPGDDMPTFTRQPANMGLITPRSDAVATVKTIKQHIDKSPPASAYGGKAMAPEPGEKSGAFIRRCLIAGADGETILTWVHAHFEGSKAKMSDIGWNRNKLKADGWVPGAAAPTPTKDIAAVHAPAVASKSPVTVVPQRKKFDPPDTPFDGGTPVVPASLVDAFIDAFINVALTLDKKMRDRIIKAIR